MDPIRVQEVIVSHRTNGYGWLKTDLSNEQYGRIEALNLPEEIPLDQREGVFARVGSIVGMDAAKVKELYDQRREKRFVWLKRDISEEEEAAVLALRKEKHIRGVNIDYEPQRYYPGAQLASSVVGFCLKDGTPAEGMEMLAKHELSARPGVRYILGDVGRRFVQSDSQFDVPPRDGGNVYLTIDTFIQSTLEQAVAEAVQTHGAKWGVGIVMNPQTGEILGMCTVPTYDPNKFNEVASPDARKNRCFVDPYEPGSAFKPVIAASAVDANMGITWQSRFNCEGGVYNAPGGGTVSDHGSHYGVLTLEDIIVNSSNIGMAKVGEKLGNHRLYEIVHRFGFGSQVPLQMPQGGNWPGATVGIIREPERNWDGYSLRRVPFGQEISVSAMQLANAYCPPGQRRRTARASPGRRGDGRLRQERALAQRAEGAPARPEPADLAGHPRRDGARSSSAARARPASSTAGPASARPAPPRSPGMGPTPRAPSPVRSSADARRQARRAVPDLDSLAHAGRPFRRQVAAPRVKEVLEKTLSYLDVPQDRQPQTSNVAAAHGRR